MQAGDVQSFSVAQHAIQSSLRASSSAQSFPFVMVSYSETCCALALAGILRFPILAAFGAVAA